VWQFGHHPKLGELIKKATLCGPNIPFVQSKPPHEILPNSETCLNKIFSPHEQAQHPHEICPNAEPPNSET
jgi:hypothetical protein